MLIRALSCRFFPSCSFKNISLEYLVQQVRLLKTCRFPSFDTQLYTVIIIVSGWRWIKPDFTLSFMLKATHCLPCGERYRNHRNVFAYHRTRLDLGIWVTEVFYDMLSFIFRQNIKIEVSSRLLLNIVYTKQIVA